MVRDIFDEMGKMTVDHNGLLIHGRLVENHFSQYCVPLVAWTGIEDYPVSMTGSASLIRYRGRSMMVTTRHQLKQAGDPEGICITLKDGPGRTRMISSGGVMLFNADMTDGDHHDIVILDFTEPAQHEIDIRSMFLDFRGQHPDVPAEMVAGAVSYGYPLDSSHIDYAKADMRLGRVRVVCRYEGQGNDDALHIMKPVVPLNFNPNGMSGGPVFTVFIQDGRFKIHLAGINARAGRDRFYVIKAGAIQMMMNAFIRARPHPADVR